jgi:hypothetical protein
MTDLLIFAVDANGGFKRWKSVRAIHVGCNYYGALLDLKVIRVIGRRCPNCSEPRTHSFADPIRPTQGQQQDHWCLAPARIALGPGYQAPFAKGIKNVAREKRPATSRCCRSSAAWFKVRLLCRSVPGILEAEVRYGDQRWLNGLTYGARLH